jgi:hypothetical protein
MKYVVQKTHYGIRFRHLFLTGYSQLFFQITPFFLFVLIANFLQNIRTLKEKTKHK